MRPKIFILLLLVRGWIGAADSRTTDSMSVFTEFSAPSHCYAMQADNTYPCIVTSNGSTYFLWCDTLRRPWITKISNAAICTVPLDTQTDYRARDDGHHKFSLGIDKAGYLHVAGDMHNYPGSNNDHLPARYRDQAIMYWKSVKPEDVASGFSFAGAPDNPARIPGVTFSYGS